MRRLYLIFPFLALYPFAWGKVAVSMDLQVGFKGVVCSRSPYALIWIKLTNSSPSTFRGFVGFKEGILQKVELASGATKTFCYVAGERLSRRAKISLFSEKGKILLSRPLPIGVIQEEPLQLILPAREIPSLPSLIGIDLKDVPDDWRALSGVELLLAEGSILDKLTAEQKRNLMKWLALGGRIIIVGDESLTKEVGEFTQSLLPVRNIRTVHLPSLPMIQVPIGTPSLTIYPGTPIGYVKWEESGYPLLVERPFSWGVVSYLAFKPWEKPFDNWQGLLYLFPPPSSRRATFLTNWEPFPFSELKEWALSPTSVNKIKSFNFRTFLLFCLIFVYVLIPSIYFGLRIKRKTSYYWITMLTTIFIICLAIFLVGCFKKERRTLVKQLTLIQYYPGTKLFNQSSVFGIYSPSSKNFSLKFREKDIIVQEMDTCGQQWADFYLEDGLKIAKNMLVPRWGMRTCEYVQWREGNSQIEASLYLEGDEIKGWIENRSDKPIRDVYLIFSQRAQRLGDLKSGERRDISFNINGFSSLEGMKRGSLYYYLEELLRLTPSGMPLYQTGREKLTSCVLLWEGEETTSLVEIEPNPRLQDRSTVYAQHILLPVKKLPSKVPFLCIPFLPLPPTAEAAEVISHLQRLSLWEGFPFQFFSTFHLNFLSTINGVKFSKIVMDIELDSEGRTDISLLLRKAKKTYEVQKIKKQKIPGHLRIELDKPDDYLMWGSYIFATLEQEFSFIFQKVNISNITVYGIPKGG
ncbi:hypothetical protein H5T88_01795 [bacterium]|nr:hypothetical protein [bacterium]